MIVQRSFFEINDSRNLKAHVIVLYSADSKWLSNVHSLKLMTVKTWKWIFHGRLIQKLGPHVDRNKL